MIAEEIPYIEKAKTLLGSDELMKDEHILLMQKQLDSMKNNEKVSNSYIYMPDVEAAGDTKQNDAYSGQQRNVSKGTPAR